MADRYVVIKVHSFDSETETVEFDDYNKARAYLHWLWEDYYNEEIANKSDLCEDGCWHEDEIAQIEWNDGEKTEFILSEIGNPRREFMSVGWKRYL